MNWRKLFNQTLSTKLKIGDRVRHRASNRLGTVYQTATIRTNEVDVPTLSVKHDDGTDAQLVPAEEYHKSAFQSLTWTRAAETRRYE